MRIRPRLHWLLALLAAIALAPSQALAQEHPPITILINESPWFAGFEALVDA